MEDDGIVKKSTIFFVVFLIVGVIVLICYLFWNNEEPVVVNPNVPPSGNIGNDDTPKINENGVYGLFVNMEDANSYFEYKETGYFKFVINVCEGYEIYNNENSTITKKVELIDDVYDITVTIKPKSTLDKNVIKFTSNLVSATGEVAEYNGPYSCSPSYLYKKALD